MNKTIGFDTRNYPNLPPSLCQAGTMTRLDDIDVDIDEFCHVVWEDSFGSVPTPNPAVASLVAILTSSPDFEFAGAGPGINTETRRNESNKYGRGFCRWLLYKHVNLTYFVTIKELVARGFPAPFNTWKIKKLQGGDTPDYFCSAKAARVYLGEAKGRLSSITWTAPKQFPKWRKQFDYVELRDPNNVLLKLKGYIVAAQMKCSTKKAKSKLFVEDPESPGDIPLSLDASRDVAYAIMACHYSEILTRIGHTLHSAFLRLGARLRTRPNRQAFVWECLIPSLQGKKFVGGAYLPTISRPLSPLYFTKRLPDYHGLLPVSCNLSVQPSTFFGLEKTIYSSVIDATYEGVPTLAAVEEFPVSVMPEGTSLLRDGTLLCPLEFMRLVEVIDV